MLSQTQEEAHIYSPADSLPMTKVTGEICGALRTDLAEERKDRSETRGRGIFEFLVSATVMSPRPSPSPIAVCDFRFSPVSTDARLDTRLFHCRM